MIESGGMDGWGDPSVDPCPEGSLSFRWADAPESMPPCPLPVLSPEEEAAWLAESRASYEVWLGELSPGDRFEVEFGLPEVPVPVVLPEVASETAAVLAQEWAVQAARVRDVADAHRVAGLLTAFEASMADLAVRFGREIGARAGLGAQAFFRSVGLQTKTHPFRVAADTDTGLLLRDRLPGTWAVFQAGSCSWTRAMLVVRQADGLDRELWADYDRVAAGLVVASDRLKSALHDARERLQPDTAPARARTTDQRRSESFELGHDGEGSIVITGPVARVLAQHDAIQRQAIEAHGRPGETRTLAQLRHDIALQHLHTGATTATGPTDHGPADTGPADHGPADDGGPDGGDGAAAGGVADTDVRVVPHVQPVQVRLVLTVPALAWLGQSRERCVLEGVGPIDLETAKALAGTATSFIRVLTDPVTGVRIAMDRTARKPPKDLDRWIRIRDGRSRFHGSTVPAHLSDIDHAREWVRDHGPTNDTNLVTLDRPIHIAKTAGLLQEEYRPDGIVGWTDAWGNHFDDPPHDPINPPPTHLIPTPDDTPCPF